MPRSAKRVVIAALNQLYVEDVRESFLPFSYGARRIQAALLEPPIEGLSVTFYESTTLDPEKTAHEILVHDPDVVGFSTYLWSFPTFCLTARIIRERRPNTTIVFGGPSSRPAMVDHPAYAWVRAHVDGLVVREGEQVMRQIVLSEDRSREALARIPGVTVPNGLDVATGWSTPASPDLLPMDSIPSPHQMGLIADGTTANLETFRGCPLACSFCEWGVYERADRVFSEEYLVRELEAFKRTKARGAYLVDAGFSLNRRAFRNLAAAEKQVRFLAENPMACEVYASNLRDDDAEFLSQVNVGRIGVGLQSFNPDVLKLMQRPFDEKKFRRGVQFLKQVCGGVALEIILGLPGDNPESFKETVRKCMDLDAGGVHVFHALVLPDGLMTRAPPGANIEFDPRTLKMLSCSTWSEKEFRDTVDWLNGFTLEAGGVVEDSFWKLPLVQARDDASRFLSVPEIFSTQHLPAAPAAARERPLPDTAVETVEGELLHNFAESILVASDGKWRAIDARTRGRHLTVRLLTPAGELGIDVQPHKEGRQAFCVQSGWAMSHGTAPEGFGRDQYATLKGLMGPFVTLANGSLPGALAPDTASPPTTAAAAPKGLLPVLR